MSDIDVEALRAMTPGCANRNHLNNAGAALLNSATIEALTGYLQREALIGGYEAEQEAAVEIDATYESLAELIGALPDRSRCSTTPPTRAHRPQVSARPAGHGFPLCRAARH